MKNEVIPEFHHRLNRLEELVNAAFDKMDNDEPIPKVWKHEIDRHLEALGILPRNGESSFIGGGTTEK